MEPFYLLKAFKPRSFAASAKQSVRYKVSLLCLIKENYQKSSIVCKETFSYHQQGSFSEGLEVLQEKMFQLV